MLTINRHPTLERPTTAKTVDAMKEISAGLPKPKGVAGAEISKNESWLEEVSMGKDAVQLVRVMVG